MRALSAEQIAEIQERRAVARRRYPFRELLPSGDPATVTSLAREFRVSKQTVMRAARCQTM